MATHSYANSRDQIHPDLANAEERKALPPVRWRLNWRNPANDRRALYVASHAYAIDGMDDRDARQLLAQLLDEATRREFVYSAQVAPGRCGDVGQSRHAPSRPAVGLQRRSARWCAPPSRRPTPTAWTRCGRRCCTRARQPGQGALREDYGSTGPPVGPSRRAINRTSPSRSPDLHCRDGRRSARRAAPRPTRSAGCCLRADRAPSRFLLLCEVVRKSETALLSSSPRAIDFDPDLHVPGTMYERATSRARDILSSNCPSGGRCGGSPQGRNDRCHTGNGLLSWGWVMANRGGHDSGRCAGVLYGSMRDRQPARLADLPGHRRHE